jgi:hypothetical protein
MAPDGGERLIFVGDDFCGVAAADTSTVIASEVGYSAFLDSDSIAQLTDEVGGVVALTTDGTDEDEIWMSTGALGKISDTAGDDCLTVFEARYKVSSIADSAMSHFIGLAKPGLAAADTVVNATGVLKANSDFIGFRTLLDGNSIDFVYQKGSAAVQNTIAGVHVPVADDFVKLGFVYDPSESASKRIKVFVNNVEQSTYVTAANIAAATFPDGVILSMLAGFKNTTAVATEMAIDWWAYAQVLKPATN